MELTLTSENIGAAAKVTFMNVVLLSLLFTVFDIARRKLSVDRPVKRITAATERIMQGDFSVRIEPFRGIGMESFNQVIHAINQMAQELGSVETLRTDFITNVSHELKPPGGHGQLCRHALAANITKEEKNEYATAISVESIPGAGSTFTVRIQRK